MTILRRELYFVLVVSLHLVILTVAGADKMHGTDAGSSSDHPKHQGQGQYFGCCGEGLSVQVMDGYPDIRNFWENFVLPSVPLLMIGAVQDTKAFKLWEDDYFLELDIPLDSTVLVEENKKENRTDPSTEMFFKDFIRVYNSTDQYMVQQLPDYLARDVRVPYLLQCPEILDNHLITDSIVWFSSGGTKSVVHTDSSHNLNCLIRGTKKFVMVDPKQKHLVDFDHPEGSYSGVDVDSVDYNRYPGLAHVDYYHIDLVPGDCLFIPHKWIHQVRSFDRNIAINIWWSKAKSTSVNLDNCDHVELDPELTMDLIQSNGGQVFTVDDVKEFLTEVVAEGNVYRPDDLAVLMIGIPLQEFESGEEFQRQLVLLIAAVDKNKNMLLEKEDVDLADEADWQNAFEVAEELRGMIEEIRGESEEGDDEEDEDDDEDDGTQWEREEL